MFVIIVNGKKFSISNRWNPSYFRLENANTKSNFTSLGNLCSERKETIDPQSYKNTIFNYIGLENIESNSAELIGFSPQLGSNIKSRSKIFYQNDILYGRLRPNLNKVYYANEMIKEGICTTEIIVLIPHRDKIIPEYMREILLSKIITDKVTALVAGAALPRIHSKDLLNLQIPLIDIEKQKKIVSWANEQRKKYAYYKNMCIQIPDWINGNIYDLIYDNKLNLPSQFEINTVEVIYDNKLP